MRRVFLFLFVFLFIYHGVSFAQPGALDLTNPPVIKADFDQFIDKLKIELIVDRPNVEIRFTGDGSDPVDTSFLYTEPLEIRGAVTVKARCFRDGKPVSGTASRTFTMVLPYAAKAVGNPASGIRYQYFEGDWDSLPDFAKLIPVKWGTLPYFSFEPRNNPERFGVVYTGYIQVPERNVYTFYTDSDDGSRLYIGNKLVVDNDGLHGMREKEGTIGLAKGFHPVTITFFKKTGSDDLNVYVKSPTLQKQLLPQDWLFY
ncbi:MAG: PA14 domain-containing protein [bacterium]